MKHLFLHLMVFSLLLLTACNAKKDTVVVNFEGGSSEMKWALAELNPDLSSDWSQYEFLTLELKSSTTQRFDLRIYDTEGVRRLTLHPFQGVWIRASIPLIHFQQRNTRGMDMAAIGKTPRPGYWIGFSSAVGSISNIDSIGVTMRRPIGNPSLELRNIRLTMTAQDTIFGPYPLVDEFGQWITAEWPGKAKSIEELQIAWAEEEDTLQTESFEVSKYGGFLGTQARATGFFHVEQINGKWWFIDPEGHYFFSTGSCGIGSGRSFPRVEGREYIYKAFAPEEVTQSGTKVGRSSFYTWNLYRRHGSDWYGEWMDLTVKRMDNWGINTIGNWSDATLGGSQRKAYVATLRGWGIETGVMGMPDVYASDYAEMVDKAAEEQCALRKNDPYLLGYFIGNEQPWPNREQELANAILSGEETPMQTALKRYLADGDTPERRKEFAYETFAKFISTVNTAIKKHDPNHLNLGIRFGGSAPGEVVKACKGFDVFSFNNYGYSVNENNMKRFYELTGLPMVIGEFHFGVPGRGMAPGLAQTMNQEERAAAYSSYVENAAANPNMIGTHWFTWLDQPCTGRNDGENYNIGFLDVTDRPYPELIKAARETFSRLLDIHSGRVPPTSRQAITQ